MLRLLSFLAACLAAVVFSSTVFAQEPAEQPEPEARPNILWITSEDNGPHLGAYGDEYATTPNLDRLAARGLLYLNCWSNAPVCAPARTCIISGVYATSTGSEHMRSNVRMPKFMRMYPQLLREAGYYCTNNSKEDYNLIKPGKVWDESSGKAHWKNRASGQPFFAVFNHTVSHESQIRKRPHEAVHDPAKVRIPAYHPDTPEVRQDWAQYYDKITEMDARVDKNLMELEEAGLAEDTIVFYYGDHGSGMPRSKRWPYNSGLHVPLIVYIPEKFKHLRPEEYKAGEKTDRLVSFVDLAPTLLSLIGQEPPEWMQGKAFLGKHAAPPREFIFGFRGRMDERYDMVRSVRDKRYVYIRNYMPHKKYGQHLAYMFQTPTTQVWKKLYDEGKLQPPQTYFWETKPAEELYDLENDPDEVRNLADSTEHQEVKTRLRTAQQNWCLEVRDLGFLPEGEIHSRSAGSTPYEMGHNDEKYAIRNVMSAAERATRPTAYSAENLVAGLDDQDSAVRYWSATGIRIRGRAAISQNWLKLVLSMADRSPYVQMAAAQAVLEHAEDAENAEAALALLLERANVKEQPLYQALFALNALDELDDKAASIKDRIAALPDKNPALPGRLGNYVPRLKEKIQADFANRPRRREN